ncbi:hypothetical protein K502DRAFT_351775 [Neoconidiobolus thromboides FSU 785]|nr:hypothetical protein K502DRAFT_351775 [Neoconidiobolus thromboides FSU 785]
MFLSSLIWFLLKYSLVGELCYGYTLFIERSTRIVSLNKDKKGGNTPNKDGNLLPLDEIDNENRKILGIGIVKASKDEESSQVILKSEDDGNDIDNDQVEADKEKTLLDEGNFPNQSVRLGFIFDWEMAFILYESSELFLNTTYVWYKLSNPNPECYSKYRDYLMRTRLIDLVINDMPKNPNLVYEEFL